MQDYRITEDNTTVVVSHQERRLELTKAGKPRKDRKTYLTTVVDAEFTGEHAWDQARATRAELTGDTATAAAIRANIAEAERTTTAPTMTPAELFARLTSN